jgi:hypothetical protein
MDQKLLLLLPRNYVLRHKIIDNEEKQSVEYKLTINERSFVYLKER